MYWFTGIGIKNSIDIMVEPTTVNIIEFTCLESCHSSFGDIYFDGNCCWGNCKFGPFCSKDFSSLGVSTQKMINTSPLFLSPSTIEMSSLCLHLLNFKMLNLKISSFKEIHRKTVFTHHKVSSSPKSI